MKMKKNRNAAVLLLVSLLVALTWLVTFHGNRRVSAETGAGMDIGQSDGDVDGDGVVEGNGDGDGGVIGEIGDAIGEGMDDLKEGAEDVRDRINDVPEKTENEGRGAEETDPGVVRDEGDKEMKVKEKDRAAGWIAAAVVVAVAAVALVIALVPKRKK